MNKLKRLAEALGYEAVIEKAGYKVERVDFPVFDPLNNDRQNRELQEFYKSECFK